MRNNARPKFLVADAGMTGGNFAIAETGSFVVCTNEAVSYTHLDVYKRQDYHYAPVIVVFQWN